jgi:L-alanine-DL-glutamate epimerase-like enolase superfamily enzyme
MRILTIAVLDATPASAAAHSWSRRAPDACPCDLLVEVELDRGGRALWGCAGASRYPERRERPSGAALRGLERLVGLDLAGTALPAPVSYEPGGESLLAVLELAVIDALGRELGLPAAALLGGVRRTRLPAYASTLAYGSVDAYVGCLAAAREQGFVAVKFHANGDPELDCEVIATAREASHDAVLIWDGEYAYDPQEALRVGRALDDAAFLWFEAPVRDDASPAVLSLSERLETPLVPGARRPRHPGSWAREVLDGVWGALRTNVTRTPSLGAALRLVRLAEALDVPCELESFGYPLTGLANLHAALATDGCRFYEVPFPTNLLGGVGTPPPLEDGYVSLPAEPGLGHGLTRETIRSACESVAEFGA